jgi:hypothetical protein
VEDERREWTWTSENEGHKKDLEDARFAHEATMRDKELVWQIEHSKLRHF